MLTSYTKDRQLANAHAAILMSGQKAQELA
jgi:hypothetical protein